jgi:hypothetical protein
VWFFWVPRQSAIGGNHAAAKLKHQTALRSSLSTSSVNSPTGFGSGASPDLTQAIESYKHLSERAQSRCFIRECGFRSKKSDARRAAPNPCEGLSLDRKDATWVL